MLMVFVLPLSLCQLPDGYLVVPHQQSQFMQCDTAGKYRLLYQLGCWCCCCCCCWAWPSWQLTTDRQCHSRRSHNALVPSTSLRIDLCCPGPKPAHQGNQKIPRSGSHTAATISSCLMCVWGQPSQPPPLSPPPCLLDPAAGRPFLRSPSAGHHAVQVNMPGSTGEISRQYW